jgi:two-component system copper resistance phosphate regulon response regulator CusR
VYAGIVGRHLAQEVRYDVVIVEARLPGLDGLELLRSLRAYSNTPAIMLSSVDRAEDRVRALEAGADDCLVKPIAFTELIARIDSVARRGVASSDKVSTVLLGDLEVDLVRRRAVRAGRRLELTAQEFSLLSLLLRHQGEVLSRDELSAPDVGHGFRRRIERAGGRCQSAPSEGGRPVRREVASHRARRGLRALERRSEPAR